MFIVQEIDSGDPLISSVLNLNIFLGKSSTLTTRAQGWPGDTFFAAKMRYVLTIGTQAGLQKSQKNHGEQNKSNRAPFLFSDNLTSWTHPSAASLNLIKLEFQGLV
jgi:hypothetical protein